MGALDDLSRVEKKDAAGQGLSALDRLSQPPGKHTGQGRVSTLDLLSAPPKKASSREKTPEQVQGQIAELEQEAAASGARTPESDRPGLPMLALDILQRPTFAVAGAAEEIFSPRAAETAEGPIERAARELFSGLAGLKGEKRAFGEVMERGGVGEGPSVEIPVPFFSNPTITARGLTGFVLDVALDPTTYIGVGPVTKIGAASTRISKAGTKMLGREIGEALPTAAGKLEIAAAPMETRLIARETLTAKASADIQQEMVKRQLARQGFAAVEDAPVRLRDVAEQRARAAAGRKAFQEVAEREAHRVTELATSDPLFQTVQARVRREAEERVLTAARTDRSLLDPGGLKWFGATIPGTPGLAPLVSGMSSKALAAVGRVPIAGKAAILATAKVKGAFDNATKLLDRDWRRRNIPAFLKVYQAHLDTHAAMTAKLLRQIQLSPAARLKESQWRRVTEAVEDGDWATKLTDPLELESARFMRQFKDNLGLEERAAGMFGPDFDPARYAEEFGKIRESVSPDRLQLHPARLEAERRMSKIEAQYPGIVERIRRQAGREASVVQGLTRGEGRLRSKAVQALEAEKGKILRDVPLEFVESSVLRHPDEARYFRRRGYELVEEDGTITAYQIKKTTAAQQGVWIRQLKSVNRRIAAAEKAAARLEGRVGQRISRISKAARRKEAQALNRANSEIEVLLNRLDRMDNRLRLVAQNRIDRLITKSKAAMQSSKLVENYVAHFYDNPLEELEKTVSVFSTKQIDRATVGRHAEERAFATLREAEEKTLERSKYDPMVKPLKPVWSPVESMRRRAENHADAIAFKSFYDMIGQQFGRPDLPFSVDDFFDLTRAANAVPPKNINEINAAIAAGKTDLNVFRSWPEDARREFMVLRLKKASSPEEAMAVLNKYGLENAPKITKSLRQLAEDGSDYVPVNIGRLKDIEIPRSIAEELKEVNLGHIIQKEEASFFRGYDRINNVFKTWVTLPWPSFHFRNAYSNIAQAFLDVGLSALSPRLHFDAVGVMAGVKGSLKTKVGTEYSYDALRELVEQHQIRVSRRQILEQSAAKTLKPISQSRLAKAGRAVAPENIETEARVALFINHLRRGLDPAEAAARVKEVLFDYSNLSHFEKKYLRRIIPFYTFTRKNIVLQVRKLRENPGRQVAFAKAFGGRATENQELTSWEASAFKVRLDRNGRDLTVLSGIDLPIRNLDIIWAGSMRKTFRRQFGMITPLFKTPVEAGFGLESFTGRRMERKKIHPDRWGVMGRMVKMMPMSVQNHMGFKEEHDAAGRPVFSFDGERFYIYFQSFILSRIVSTTDRQFREYLNDREFAASMLDVLTGLRLKTLNLDNESQRRYNERLKALEDAAVMRGDRSRFQITFKPKER